MRKMMTVVASMIPNTMVRERTREMLRPEGRTAKGFSGTGASGCDSFTMVVAGTATVPAGMFAETLAKAVWENLGDSAFTVGAGVDDCVDNWREPDPP